MGIGISFAVGNFMLKSDYDPNNVGKIEKGVLAGGSMTGAIIDYEDCTDYELDSDPSAVTCGACVNYENIGTPYTVALADMNNRCNDVKVTVAGEIKPSAGAETVSLAYNIDGGADQLIGTHTGDTTYTLKSATLVEVAVGEVIQFRLKRTAGTAYCQLRTVTETHGARKALTGYY